MCGYDAPDEIISSSNQILIKFHTDDHDTGSGYRIKIEKGTVSIQIQYKSRIMLWDSMRNVTIFSH